MIIDASMVFNELDILELRMAELHDVVDHFIFVESAERFGSLEKKPLCLDVIKSLPKVTVVQLSVLSPEYTDVMSGWLREKYQRESMMAAIESVSISTDDVAIVADVDEIPSADAIVATLPKLVSGMHRFTLDFFYYNVNSFLGESPLGPTIGTIQQYREMGGTHESRTWGKVHNQIKDAGWHFSYFGGLDRIKKKVASFSHSQDDFCKEFLARDDEEAKKDIDARQDLFRRPELNKFEYRASDDSRLPQTFLNNPERYKHFTEEGMWSRAKTVEKS